MGDLLKTTATTFRTIFATTLALTFMSSAGNTGETFRPDAIDFTMTLETAREQLKQHCTSINERQIDPPELPGTLSNHTQIDCQGLDFKGKGRLAEFAFRDGKLFLVWVLTDGKEIPVLETLMRSTFGDPSHQSDKFTAFTVHQLALRKDIPEVLFYSAANASMFTAWFEQSVATDAKKSANQQ